MSFELRSFNHFYTEKTKAGLGKEKSQQSWYNSLSVAAYRVYATNASCHLLIEVQICLGNIW